MDPLLTIYIPCYNQPHYLRECLISILGQSFQDFTVVLIDDASNQDYAGMLSSFNDRRIVYTRNPVNLGAMRNMLTALKKPTASPYLMVFHEDDLMAPASLETQISILKDAPELIFVASEMLFFNHPETLPKDPLIVLPKFEIYDDVSDLVRAIFQGALINFGSVVYRKSALEGVDPEADYDKYLTLCDRPFLCRLMKKGKGALIREQLVYCRKHGSNDERSKGLSVDHLISFLRFYRSCLPPNWSRADRTMYYKYSTNSTFDMLLKPGVQNNEKVGLILRSVRYGILHPAFFARHLAIQALAIAYRITSRCGKRLLISLHAYDRFLPIWREYKNRA